MGAGGVLEVWSWEGHNFWGLYKICEITFKCVNFGAY